MKPLSGMTILDLTHMLSGPYCGMLLADMGARVIKVEPPQGEATRALLASDPKNSLHGMGAYFLTLNRNKESVVIDLKQPEGRELFCELVKHADIVLNNFGPGVPQRLGIDYATLAKHNPRIITCSITGFGESGPAPNRPAFDLVAQGMGGGMSITGSPETGPLRAGIPIGDLGGGLFGAIGILAALNSRNSTGRGQHIDISMLDVQASLLNYMATMYFLSGEVPEGIGNSHFVHVPYGTYPTRSEWIIIACLGDHIWARCADALGVPDLQSQLWAKQPDRLRNRVALEARVSEVLKTRDRAEWLEIFAQYGVPVAPVNNLSDALNDPQLRSRDMVVRVEHPDGGSVDMPGNPVKMSDTSDQDYTPPPLLGQQTDSVLKELLGFDEAKLEQLRASKVVY